MHNLNTIYIIFSTIRTGIFMYFLKLISFFNLLQRKCYLLFNTEKYVPLDRKRSVTYTNIWIFIDNSGNDLDTSVQCQSTPHLSTPARHHTCQLLLGKCKLHTVYTFVPLKTLLFVCSVKLDYYVQVIWCIENKLLSLVKFAFSVRYGIIKLWDHIGLHVNCIEIVSNTTLRLAIFRLYNSHS